MGYTSLRGKHNRTVLYMSKKSRRTTTISHINSNKSNNLNTSNGDNVVGTSKFTNRNVQNGC